MNPKSIPEIKVKFINPTPHSDRIKIDSSKKLKDVLCGIRESDLIEYRESFYVLLLDHGLNVIGYRQMSTGGIAGTLVDIRQMLALALKANASGIAVAHNHPSGSNRPSEIDVKLTERIKQACEYIEIKLLDHLILTPQGDHYSFAEEGKI